MTEKILNKLNEASYRTPFCLQNAIELLLHHERKGRVLKNYCLIDASLSKDDLRIYKKSIKKARSFYDRAIRSIKRGDLRARTAIDIERKMLDPEEHYVVSLGDFLVWATENRIKLNAKIYATLKMFCPRPGSKFNSLHAKIQIVAQVLWFLHPTFTIIKMEKDPIFQQLGLIPKDGYRRDNTFRDIVKIIDPRSEAQKRKQPKKNQNIKIPRQPPRPIPGILQKTNGKMRIDLRKLIVVADTLALVLHQQKETIANELEHDLLVELYLQNASQIVRETVFRKLRPKEYPSPF